MKEFMTESWSAVMDNRRSPLRHLDLASQHYFMQVLGWMWSEDKGIQYLAWDGSIYSASSIDGISPQASHQMYRTANSLEKLADQ